MTVSIIVLMTVALCSAVTPVQSPLNIEYNTPDGVWCIKCSPGTHLLHHCKTNHTNAQCGLCEDGSFTSDYNTAEYCELCMTACETSALVPIRNCTHSSNLVCECPTGTFNLFPDLDKYHAVCREFGLCPAGYGVLHNGTSDAKTKCVRCVPRRTFSSSTSATDECQPCTQCGIRDILNECTLTQDRICAKLPPDIHNISTRDNANDILFAVIGSVTVLVVAGVFGLWKTKKLCFKHDHESGGGKQPGFDDVRYEQGRNSTTHRVEEQTVKITSARSNSKALSDQRMEHYYEDNLHTSGHLTSSQGMNQYPSQHQLQATGPPQTSLGPSSPQQTSLGPSPPKQTSQGPSPPQQTSPRPSSPQQTSPRPSSLQQTSLGPSTPQQTSLGPSSQQQTFLGPSPPQQTSQGPSPPQQTSPQPSSLQHTSLGPSTPQQTSLWQSTPQQTSPRPSSPQQIFPRPSSPQQTSLQPSSPSLPQTCRYPFAVLQKVCEGLMTTGSWEFFIRDLYEASNNSVDADAKIKEMKTNLSHNVKEQVYQCLKYICDDGATPDILIKVLRRYDHHCLAEELLKDFPDVFNAEPYENLIGGRTIYDRRKDFI